MGQKGFGVVSWLILVIGVCLLASIGWYFGQSTEKNTFTLLTLDGRPIANTSVSVYSDTGIRCIAAPCPTNAKEWSGKTNARGVIKVPSKNIQSYTTVTPQGYDGAVLSNDTAKTTHELKFKITTPLPY